MKSWNELNYFQRAILGMLVLIAAALLPEIAFLVNFWGMEVAFALVFASVTPFLTWFYNKFQSIKHTVNLAYIAYGESPAGKPSFFMLQAGFCVLAFAVTGSGVMAFSFFVPGMFLNGIY